MEMNSHRFLVLMIKMKKNTKIVTNYENKFRDHEFWILSYGIVDRRFYFAPKHDRATLILIITY